MNKPVPIFIVATDGKSYLAGSSPLSAGNLAGAVSPRAAPATFLPHGTRPMCEACGRGFYGCICDMPEPDVMPVEDMKRVMPGLFKPHDGSVWLAAEEAAVRSSFGMPGK